MVRVKGEGEGGGEGEGEGEIVPEIQVLRGLRSSMRMVARLGD